MLTQNDHAIFFNGDQVLRSKKGDSFIIPCRRVYKKKQQIPPENEFFFIGENGDKKVFGVSYDKSMHEEEFSFTPVRDALAMAHQKTAQLICRAKHLLNWHKNSLYSGCCGTSTTLSSEEIAKVCQTCKKTIYPTSSNFVIVLIEKEDGKLLLARSPHFKKGMYSTIAGFVEAGETYEDAVQREAEEEVGVKVEEIRYFGSQSWPFPSSMAAAFLVKYKSGEIRIDSKEIEDAQWFDPKRLPELPHPCSISRHIIDHYKNSSMEK